MDGKSPRIRLTPAEHAAVERWRRTGKESAPPVTLKERVAEADLREQVSAAGRREKELTREVLRLTREGEGAAAFAAQAAERGAVEIAPPPRLKAGSGARGWYVGPTSDWHSGKRIDRREVEGLQEFNPDVADKRVRNFFTNTAWLMGRERLKGIDLHTLVLPLQGDFIDGHLHEDSVQRNYMSPVEEALWVTERLRGGLRYLLKHAGVEGKGGVVAVCSLGNHGRLTKKMLAGAASEKTNLETMIYRTLMQEFTPVRDNVRFVFEPSYATVLKFDRMRLRFHHGEKIMYQGGVGGLTIPLYKWIYRKNSISGGEKLRADYDVIGHHHTLMQGDKAHVNGALCGTTPWGLEKGFSDPAMHGSFVVKEGFEYPICKNVVFLNEAHGA